MCRTSALLTKSVLNRVRCLPSSLLFQVSCSVPYLFQEELWGVAVSLIFYLLFRSREETAAYLHERLHWFGFRTH